MCGEAETGAVGRGEGEQRGRRATVAGKRGGGRWGRGGGKVRRSDGAGGGVETRRPAAWCATSAGATTRAGPWTPEIENDRAARAGQADFLLIPYLLQKILSPVIFKGCKNFTYSGKYIRFFFSLQMLGGGHCETPPHRRLPCPRCVPPATRGSSLRRSRRRPRRARRASAWRTPPATARVAPRAPASPAGPPPNDRVERRPRTGNH